jgi:hypothetical protein
LGGPQLPASEKWRAGASTSPKPARFDGATLGKSGMPVTRKGTSRSAASLAASPALPSVSPYITFDQDSTAEFDAPVYLSGVPNSEFDA